MTEEITRLSFFIEEGGEDAPEAQLSRAAHRYFAAVGVEAPLTAIRILDDLIGELADIRDSIILDGLEQNPRIEPALNTSFGLMTLSDAEEIMRKRYLDEVSEVGKEQLLKDLESKVRRGEV
jgi:hypothetical protein